MVIGQDIKDVDGLVSGRLDGAPGVHSARFAAMDRGEAGNSNDAENNAKLLRLLNGIPPGSRSARFRCLLAVLEVTRTAGRWVLKVPVTFSGSCEGEVLNTPAGKGGFGYDPLFRPNGFEQTFSELGAEVKNQISHRASACKAFSLWLAEA